MWHSHKGGVGYHHDYMGQCLMVAINKPSSNVQDRAGGGPY